MLLSSTNTHEAYSYRAELTGPRSLLTAEEDLACKVDSDFVFDCFNFGFAYVDPLDKSTISFELPPPSPFEYKPKFWPLVVIDSCASFTKFATLYTKVCVTALPNYLKAKVPVPS